MMDGRVADAIKTLIDASAELGKSHTEPKLRLDAELLAAAGASVRYRPVSAGRLESLRERVQGRRPAERVLLAHLAFEQVFDGGHAAYAAELATRALADGALLTEQGSESMTYYTAVWTLALCDQLTPAAAALDAAIANARVHGSAASFAAASSFRAVVNYRSGMLLDAEADARAALAVNMDLRGGFSRPFATGVLADALIDRGDLEQAADALAHVDAANSDSITVNSMLFSRRRLRLLRGDAEGSLSDLLEIGRRSAGWGRTVAILPRLSTTALALARLDRHDEAGALAEQELAMARAFDAPRALAIALCASGLLAVGQEAIERPAEASSVLKGSPALLERARVLVELRSRATPRQPAQCRHCTASRRAAHRRANGRQRPFQPRDRASAVRHRANHRMAPRSDLPQARRALTPRPTQSAHRPRSAAPGFAAAPTASPAASALANGSGSHGAAWPWRDSAQRPGRGSLIAKAVRPAGVIMIASSQRTTSLQND